MENAEVRNFNFMGWEIRVEITPCYGGRKPYAEVMARPYGDYRDTLNRAGITDSVKQFSEVIRFKDGEFNYDKVCSEIDDAVVNARAHVSKWVVKADKMLDDAINGRKESRWFSAAIAAASSACNRKGMRRV